MRGGGCCGVSRTISKKKNPLLAEPKSSGKSHPADAESFVVLPRQYYKFYIRYRLGLVNMTRRENDSKQRVAQVKSLPLEVFPVPAVHPSNPLTYLFLLSYYIAIRWTSQDSHSTRVRGYYSTTTRSVNIVDEAAATRLWSCGFFGKGSLSRSQPEWFARECKRRASAKGTTHGNMTAAEVTNKRREERKDAKRQRAQREAIELDQQLIREGKAVTQPAFQSSPKTVNSLHNFNASPDGPELSTTLASTNRDQAIQKGPLENIEHLQLSPEEAFHLSYGLGILDVYTEDGQKLSNQDLCTIFCRTSVKPATSLVGAQPSGDQFLLYYAVYHHYRSLGWVVRPGIKFSVDFLLYARGPVFSHAEFAVIVNPQPSSRASAASKESGQSERQEWWYLHCVNRVQNQVLKTLVVAYVDQDLSKVSIEPDTQPIADALRSYKVRDFVVKRWTANRNRG